VFLYAFGQGAWVVWVGIGLIRSAEA
jgi:hypothetical protein